MIANLPCGTHYYDDYEGTPNEQHTYKVIAVLERAGGEFQALPLKVQADFPALSIPYYFHASFGYRNSVIGFRYIPDAVDGFYVYRSTSSNLVAGDVIAIITDDNELNNTIFYEGNDFVPQTNYYYGVAAFSKRNGVTYISPINSLTAPILSPKIPRPYVGEVSRFESFNTINISYYYERAIAIDGFELERKRVGQLDANFALIKTLDAGQRIYSDVINAIELPVASGYDYRIRAFKRINGIKYYSDYSNSAYGSVIMDLGGEKVAEGFAEGIVGANAGYSVAIADNWMAIGFPGFANNSGKVSLYKFDGKNWNLHQSLQGYPNSRFGHSIDIDNGRMVVGGPAWTSNQGLAYMYHLVDDTWIETGFFSSTVYGLTARIGHAVAIKGDWVLIGVPDGANSTSGNLNGLGVLLKYNGSNYEFNTPINGPGIANSRDLGYAVDISDDYLVIGDWNHKSSVPLNGEGAAFVYKRVGNTWGKMTQITPIPITNEQIGISVSLEDNQIMVGSNNALNGMVETGKVYTYQLEDTTWVEKAPILSPNKTTKNFFGRSISIHEDYAVIGAQDVVGKAYLYKKSNNTWSFVRSLVPTQNVMPLTLKYGNSVGISSKFVVVGDDFYNNFKGAAYQFPIDSMITSVSATDGTFQTRTRIDWTYVGNLDLIQGFNIYRDGSLIVSASPTDNFISDTDGIPGKDYIYTVESVWEDGLLGFSKADEGYRKGNGEISGSVKTFSGNVPVSGVTITVSAMIEGEYYSYTDITDQAGNFSFAGLLIGENPVDFTINAALGDHKFTDNDLVHILSAQNSSIQNLFFYDETAYVISGLVKQANTTCGLDSIRVKSITKFNDGTATIEKEVMTNSEGRYNLVIDPTLANLSEILIEIDTIRILGSNLNKDTLGYDFQPRTQSYTNFNDFPINTELDFIDQLTYPVELIVQDACELPISADAFSLRITSTDGCYDQLHQTINNNGKVIVNLPALDFNIKVEDVDNPTQRNLLVLDYFRFKPQKINLFNLHRDSARVVSTERLAELTQRKFTFHRPPNIRITNGLTYLCLNNQDAGIVEQGKDYAYTIQVKETHETGICGVQEGYLKISNPGAQKKDTIIQYDAMLGAFPAYRFKGGNPNVVQPHLWTISIDYFSAGGKFQGRLNQPVFVKGTIKLPGNDVIVQSGSDNGDVQLPLFILRDPPGDGSSSTIETGTTISKTIAINENGGAYGAAFVETKATLLGFGAFGTFSVGFGGNSGRSRDWEYSFTTTQTLSTSDVKTGPDADVIVGVGMALQYGIQQTFDYDKDSCTISSQQKVGFTPTKINTTWIYTVGQLKDIIAELDVNIGEIKSEKRLIEGADRKQLKKEDAVSKFESFRDNWKKVLDYHAEKTLPHYVLCTNRRKAETPTINADIKAWQCEFCPKVGAYDCENEKFTSFDKAAVWTQELMDLYNKANTAIRKLENAPLDPGVLSTYRFTRDKLTQTGAYVDAAYDAQFGAMAENITFAGGTSITKSINAATASRRSYSNSFFMDSEISGGALFETTKSVEVGNPLAGSITEVFKSETKIGLKVNVDYTFSEDRSVTEARTVGISYTLSDNDIGDQFSTTIIQGPAQNHTPYFALIGGRTSCPVEQPTIAIARDAVDIQLVNPTTLASYGKSQALYNVPATDPAVFYLQITNKNSFGETRDINVFLDNATNTNAAFLRLGSQFLGEVDFTDHAPFDPLVLPITLERGLLSYAHDSIMISAWPTCRDGSSSFTAGLRDSVYLSAQFISPCSPITVVEPESNWVIHENVMDGAEELRIGIRDYNPNNTNLTDVSFQYRRLGLGEPWEEMDNSTVTKAMLKTHNEENFGETGRTPIYYFVWDITNENVPDGDYEIRAIATCGDIEVITFSNVVSGTINRSQVQLLGTPEPSDGIWTTGDEIAVVFNKNMDCTLFDDPDFIADNFSLIVKSTGATIPATIVCLNNKLVITTTADMSTFDGDSLMVSIANASDAKGNIAATVEWTFAVVTHPIYTNVREFNLEMYKGTQQIMDIAFFNNTDMLVTSNLSTIKGSTWLSFPEMLAIPDIGTNLSLGINALNLGTGEYTDTLQIEVAGQTRQPRIIINLRVFEEAPNWSVGENYTEQMTMVSNFQFGDNVLSADKFDIISVWLNDTLRGVGNIENVGMFNVAYLTIHGNLADARLPLEFRVWDASQGKEFNAFPQETIPFVADTIIGTTALPNILEIDADTDIARYIPLNQGWNWFSLNTTLSDNSVTNWLKSLKNLSDGDQIKTGDKFAQYLDGVGWTAAGNQDLTTLSSNEGYLIYLENGPDTLRVSGSNASPQNIQVKKGWNWIGYPMQNANSLESGINISGISNQDVIKTIRQDNTIVSAQYNSTTSDWTGTLSMIKPYDGYKIQINNPIGGILQYTEGDNFRGDETTELISGARSSANPTDESTWNMSNFNYEYNLPLVAKVSFNGIITTNTNDRIAAFVGNDLRGVGTIQMVDAVNRPVVSLMIGGLEANEVFTLYYYNASENVVYEVAETISLDLGVNNKGSTGFGQFSNPYAIEISLFTVTIQKQDVSCIADNSGFIEVTPEDAFSPTYKWSHDANETSNLVQGLSAGSYTVSITDIRNVPVVKTIEILNQKETIAPPVVVGAEIPLCKGESVALIASSSIGATFKWYDAAETEISSSNRLILANPQTSENIKVVAIINGVCQSAFTEVEVKVIGVESDFEVDDTTPGVDVQEVVFIPTTQDANFTYLWDFGDGTSSMEVLGKHTYTTLGQFTVSLSLSSPEACSSVNVKLNYIRTSIQETPSCGPTTSFTGNIPSGIYRGADQITASGTADVGKDVELRAGTAIVLKTGFHAKANSSFLAKIEACEEEVLIDLAEERAAPPNTQLLRKYSIATENDLFIQPNPSMGFGKIKFYLDHSSNVELVVYNAQGKLVNRLIRNQFYKKGEYEINYDGLDLGYGVYHITLKKDEQISTKKLIIIR